MTDRFADSYVPNAGWRQPRGRADAIDEVADQFERRRDAPVAGAEAVDLDAYRSAAANEDAARLAG